MRGFVNDHTGVYCLCIRGSEGGQGKGKMGGQRVQQCSGDGVWHLGNYRSVYRLLLYWVY